MTRFLFNNLFKFKIINGIIDISQKRCIDLVNEKIESKNGFKILVISNFLNLKDNQKLNILMKDNGFVKLKSLTIDNLFDLSF